MRYIPFKTKPRTLWAVTLDGMILASTVDYTRREATEKYVCNTGHDYWDERDKKRVRVVKIRAHGLEAGDAK
jgi:hypothetical protein